MFPFPLFERVFTSDFKWLFEDNQRQNLGQESSPLGNKTIRIKTSDKTQRFDVAMTSFSSDRMKFKLT